MQEHPVPPPDGLEHGVALAPLTTLELGGAATYGVEVSDAPNLVEALRWAGTRGVPVTIIGGGTNTVVADGGFDGLVIRIMVPGLTHWTEHGEVMVTAGAGEIWDRVVEWAVDRGLAGIECLSGIPGTAGATPVQNVGAYGQEVAEVVDAVTVLDRRSLEIGEVQCEDCGFGYRTSRFRRERDRHVVLAVRLRLRPDGEPVLRYEELVQVAAECGGPPTLSGIRQAVLSLRRRKSMVLDPDDPNRRSAGSFFVNPVLASHEWSELADRALRSGAAASVDEVPRFAAGDGRMKVPAAWLIERSGFCKGHRAGAVGLSSRHALALVHHGGGTTAELLALARAIRRAVAERFAIVLRPEPVFVGFAEADPLGEVSG